MLSSTTRYCVCYPSQKPLHVLCILAILIDYQRKVQLDNNNITIKQHVLFSGFSYNDKAIYSCLFMIHYILEHGNSSSKCSTNLEGKSVRVTRKY